MSPPLPLPLSLRLPAQLASVAQARDAVLRHLAHLMLPQHLIYSLELVLEEVVMNICMHAYPDGDDRGFEVHVEVTPERLLMRWTDEGAAFDPTAAVLAASPESLESAKAGGLGLRLIQKRADALAYVRQEGRNILTIWFALPTAEKVDLAVG